MSKKKNGTQNKNTASEKRAAKKAVVLGTDKKSRMPMVSFLIIFAFVIAGGVFFVLKGSKEVPEVSVPAPSDVSADHVTYPAALFDDGKARHFEYRADDGITIKYFILKSSDGVVRAAFDACDVCWPAGKGYYQNGDVMVCRNCGRQFESVMVNEVKGGCNPAPLNREIADGKVTIRIEDILTGRQYFDFSRRPKK